VLKKLLRPGLSYGEVFESIIHRKWLRHAAKFGFDPDPKEGSTFADEKPKLQVFNANEIRLAFRDLGIALQPDEVNIVVEAFDRDIKGGVNMQSLLKFTGHCGPRDDMDIRDRLQNLEPLWMRTDRKTGLANKPPSPTESRNISTGGRAVSKVKTEIQRRREILEQFNVNSGVEKDDSIACHLRQWMKDDGKILREKRARALEELLEKSKERRDEARLRKLLQQGSPPGAPSLYCAKPDDPDVKGTSLEESLPICWDLPEDSLVAFFSLEMSGAKGSRTQRNNIFREVFRDPPNPDKPFRYRVWIKNLDPGTSYTFRIRAFNGFGPGPFTWQTFTTQPARPKQPWVVGRTPRSVTVRWLKTEADLACEEVLNRLKSAFMEDRPVTRVSELEWLFSAQGQPLRAGASQEDPAIATSSQATVLKVWEWLRAQITELEYTPVAWDTILHLISVYKEVEEHSSRPCARPDRTQIMYKVEKCVSLAQDVWDPLFITRFGEACVNALEPGQPCRIRVVAVNDKKLLSRPSDSLVVTPFLEPPRAPEVVDVGSSHVVLRWPQPSALRSSRGKGLTEDTMIVNDWTATSTSKGGPISIQDFFRLNNNQRDDGSKIDSTKLGKLLEDYGVRATPRRIADALEQLGGKKTVDEKKFIEWWDSGKAYVEVRRTGGRSGEPRGTLCYEGRSSRCEVKGLHPNTAYRFTLQAFFPQAETLVSAPVRVVTAPAACSSPAVVKTVPSEVTVRWFPEKHGASRYVLEGRMVKALDALLDPASKIAEKKIKARSWRSLFEGKEFLTRVGVSRSATSAHGTSLYPNSVYDLRLVAVSADGQRSEPSAACRCRTLDPRVSRGDATLRPAKVNEAFSTECTGDLVLGDTVVFTEKLWVDAEGRLLPSDRTGSRRGRAMQPAAVATAAMVDIRRASQRKGQCIGERTIAGEVIFDSAYVADEAVGAERDFTHRWFRIKVLWSTVSSADLEHCLLKRDSTVERQEQGLYDFEIFRAEWVHEDHRKKAEVKGGGGLGCA